MKYFFFSPPLKAAAKYQLPTTSLQRLIQIIVLTEVVVNRVGLLGEEKRWFPW